MPALLPGAGERHSWRNGLRNSMRLLPLRSSICCGAVFRRPELQRAILGRVWSAGRTGTAGQDWQIEQLARLAFATYIAKRGDDVKPSGVSIAQAGWLRLPRRFHP